MKLKIEDWEINATVDEDGHLTLSVEHEDNSEPISCSDDFDLHNVWMSRFTTEKIEEEYKKEEYKKYGELQ